MARTGSIYGDGSWAGRLVARVAMALAVAFAGLMAMAVEGQAGFTYPGAAMENYCIRPPYSGTSTVPNILLIQDNSYVTGGPAYKNGPDSTLADIFYMPDNTVSKAKILAFFIFVRDKYELGTGTPKLRDIYAPGITYPGRDIRMEFKYDLYGYHDRDKGPDAGTGANPPVDNDYTHYMGYFRANVMYRYDNNGQFFPDPNGIYSGAMLNWATTSMYDIIVKVLAGGKGTSIQNVNRLKGLSVGDWRTLWANGLGNWPRTYIYMGTDNVFYACDLYVNYNPVTQRVDDQEKLTITETKNPWVIDFFMTATNVTPAGLGFASPPRCGLLRGVGPHTTWKGKNISYNTPGPASERYASAPGGTGTSSGGVLEGIANKAASLLNAVLSALSTEAEAVPSINMTSLSLADANQNQAYLGDSVGVVGSSGYHTKFSHTVSPAFPGTMVFNEDGSLSGTPTGTLCEDKVYSITVTLKYCKNNDWDNATNDCKTSPGWTSTSPEVATFRVLSNAVRITKPDATGNLGTAISTGGVFFNFVPEATGGTTPYTWSWSEYAPSPSAFADLTAWLAMADTSNGRLSGNARTPIGLYQFYLSVTGGGCTDTDLVSLTVTDIPSTLMITSPLEGEVITFTEGVSKTFTPTAIVSPAVTQVWTKDITLVRDLAFTGTTGAISGIAKNNPSTAGDYPIALTVTASSDSGNTDTVNFILRVERAEDPPMVFNIESCVGGYGLSTAGLGLESNGYGVENCDDHADKSDEMEERKGLIQDFWGQAYFGHMTFDNDLSPNIGKCTSNFGPNLDEMPADFKSAVQTAQVVPTSGTFTENLTKYTKLVDAEYEGVRFYRGDPMTIQNCDPYVRDTKVASEKDKPDCASNYILMITAGFGVMNPPLNSGGVPYDFSTDPNTARSPATLTPVPPFPTDTGREGCGATVDTAACSLSTGNRNCPIVRDACYGYKNDLKATKPGTQNVSTYVVNAMGKNGAVLKEVARDGSDSADHYYYASNSNALKDKIKKALEDILKRAASGTASSVIASGEGQGANIIQAVFYPMRNFRDTQAETNTPINWIGRLANYWFYVDPYFSYSSIREETTKTPIPELNLANDYIVELYFDTISSVVRAKRYKDVDYDGIPDSTVSVTGPDGYDLEFERLSSLWEAGSMLWARNITNSTEPDYNPRRIYVNVDDAAGTPDRFVTALAADSTFRTWTQTVSQEEAEKLILFINGVDFPEDSDFRSRSVKVDLDGDGETTSTGETEAKVWKLGDVINSTPKIASWVRLNKYDDVDKYSDSTYAEFYKGIKAAGKRGYVYAGANDGMLHAFKLGWLDLESASGAVKAKIQNPDPTVPLGTEMWAFIPKNALPFLKYTADFNYCHVYTVDMTPYIFDASIGRPTGCSEAATSDCTRNVESWRTILIGGMRYGGGCKAPTAVCTMDTDNSGGLATDKDCVRTPVDGVGYSSYFALDVTDQDNPKFLWEYTNPDLGYAMSGPAVVRINASKLNTVTNQWYDDGNANGNWYVVFGSGATGPIDTEPTRRQFLGNSDQALKFFVVDLATGAELAEIGTGISYAFSGLMTNATNDPDMNYEDDVLYMGYTKKCTDDALPACDAPANESEKLWNNGGIGRILTGGDEDPTKWKFGKVIDDIGPITASVGRLQDLQSTYDGKERMWIYAGTGRYFYLRPEAADISSGNAATAPSRPDDPRQQRHIIAVTDPCYNSQSNPYPTLACPTARLFSELTDATVTSAGFDPEGCYITLEKDSLSVTGGYAAERVISNPSPTTAEYVLMASFRPYADQCSTGGESYVWAFKYDNCGAPGNLLQGMAVMQTSTGSIEKIDLSKSFTEKGGRRTTGKIGAAPQEGLSPTESTPPLDRVLHMIERK